MRKISLIIQREYLTRVRQKSFIVMTIIGPVVDAQTGGSDVRMGAAACRAHGHHEH